MVKRLFIDFEQVIIRKINSNKWYCFMFGLKNLKLKDDLILKFLNKFYIV